MIQVREIKESDAEDFLNLCKRLDEETQFMMLEPGERLTTVEEQQERIRNILLKDNQTTLVAEYNEKLVGYLGALGCNYRKNRTTVYLVIGVLQVFTGQGIGIQLFTKLERWAREHKVRRLELTVMTHNDRANRLYQKIGFEIEGTKKHSLFVNGVYVDEYYMARLLL